MVLNNILHKLKMVKKRHFSSFWKYQKWGSGHDILKLVPKFSFLRYWIEVKSFVNLKSYILI